MAKKTIIGIKWKYEIGEGVWATVYFSTGQVIKSGRFFHITDAVRYMVSLSRNYKRVG